MADHNVPPHSELDHPDQWVDSYGDYLFRYAMTRVANRETAEDIVQEALVAAVQSYGRFQGRSSVKTWLIAILKRKIVDHYRRKSNHQETHDIEAVAHRTDQLFDTSGHWRSMPAHFTTFRGDERV